MPAATVIAAGLLGDAPADAAFPGNDGKIAFDALDQPEADRSVYTVNPDGTGLTELTTQTNNDFAPDWSPDGNRVAFVSARDGNQEIYVMNADGTAQTRVTNTAAEEWQPAWSPDGERIAFTRGGYRTGPLFVMNANGTGESPLTTGVDPAWSPDGTRIAFTDVGPAPSNPVEIFVIDRDGTNRTQVTPSEPPFPPYYFSSFLAPDWTPDGSRIAFVSASGAPSEEEFQSIHLIRPDGTGQTTVVELGGAQTGAIAVSPSGTRIAYNYGIIDIDGSDPQYLNLGSLDTMGGEGDLDWRPLPVNTPSTYARPKAATPIYLPLVPAYATCATPNRVSSAPLSFSSCSPPQPPVPHPHSRRRRRQPGILAVRRFRAPHRAARRAPAESTTPTWRFSCRSRT